MKDFTGQRVVVMGLGRFGGGVGVTRYLAGRGARVLVTDQLSAVELGESVERLADLKGVSLRLGGHVERDFAEADLVVVNPAVKRGGGGGEEPSAFLRAAVAAGVTLTSEVRLLIEEVGLGEGRKRVIGVTGTAGKSTTTAMIGHILRHVGITAHTGGNLGGSLLDQLDQRPGIEPDDVLVLELSSFMLEALRPLEWSPGVAVVANVTPNHLDWHGSFDAYARSKAVLLEHQKEGGDLAVLGLSVRDRLGSHVRAGTVAWVDDRPGGAEVSVSSLAIPGWHNRLNAAFAVSAVVGVGVEEGVAMEAVRTFAGLPHRLQRVDSGAKGGAVRFINDSKATTPEATRLALDACDEAGGGGVHLIVGGYDKGSDLTPLAEEAARRCRGVYTIGATGDAFAAAAEAVGGGHARVVRCGTLEVAVREAVTAAAAGDTVLLSPASASWDQFPHFEARGQAFLQCVRSVRP